MQLEVICNFKFVLPSSINFSKNAIVSGSTVGSPPNMFKDSISVKSISERKLIISILLAIFSEGLPM